MHKAKAFMRRLLRDVAGNVLPIAAIGMVVAAAVVGSAIDMSQSYRVDNRLQAACDAAVLAGRKAVTTIGPDPDGFNTAASTVAKNYFWTNFNDNSGVTSGTVFTASSDDNGVTVKGVATTTYSTTVMRLFGFKTFGLSVSCSSSMSMGNADVVMVLDTTGSMSSSLGSTTRIQALRDAMNNFYTTVSNATKATNARVRYGFVPFAMTVNVGKLIYAENPDYLVDTHGYWSRDYAVTAISDGTTTYSSASSSSWSQYSSTSYASSSACTTASPANDTDYSNYGDPTTSSSTSNGVTTTSTVQNQRKYSYTCQSTTVTSGKGNNKTTSTVWYIYQMYYYRTATTPTSKANYEYRKIDTFPVSTFKTGATVSTATGTKGASVSSTWDGCIEERGTQNSATFSYSTVTGMSPSEAYDVDIDLAPDTSKDETKWVPMWLDVTYRQKTSGGSYTYSPNDPTLYGDHPTTDNCSSAAQLLTEMDSSSFSDYANSLTPSGNTYLDIGIIWGGRLLSPDGIFADNVNKAPSNGGKVSRHLIFMTDGEMNTTSTSLSAWGLEFWDRHVTADGSTDNDARHTQRFRAVCDAIKAKGIRLWVIAFTGTLNSDLTYCASDNSSFVADDADALNTAFQSIATKVGELRVTQ